LIALASMSPEPAPARTFGRTPAAAARAAVVLFLIGSGVVLLIESRLTREGTPLGEALRRAGISPLVPLVFGIGSVAALALYGYVAAVRGAQRFHVSPEGLRVEGGLGEYTLEWANVRGVEATRGNALGIRVRSRERVVGTHRGTEKQREWLRTMEPYGEWDFLYPRAELGVPPEQVLEWVSPYLQSDGESPASV
ncbi:MAG TPA: PH domain-containing protein, partial [Armatimonadota bacterium]|nr:PH domain-containing protein [Armatimonadota bacterium]